MVFKEIATKAATQVAKNTFNKEKSSGSQFSGSDEPQVERIPIPSMPRLNPSVLLARRAIRFNQILNRRIFWEREVAMPGGFPFSGKAPVRMGKFVETQGHRGELQGRGLMFGSNVSRETGGWKKSEPTPMPSLMDSTPKEAPFNRRLRG